ncbi:MAG: 2-C-methyl-D-erythritol 2,4-cyclodiphosphate synthase [Acidobacteria bacterium]|nr:2-C-methyl-D-erythritol 2,4-cyclodiphosphate synthase [Acidobacteriota bacterium]
MAEGRRSPGRGGRRALPAFRIGCGTDVHPLAPGRRLVLGGVEIAHDRGLAGHSDADVLAHAVCDALLGALGLPDMGTRFPDTDERHRGRSSLLFVKEVMAEARAAGYALVNLDAVVLAEAPRLGPHLEAMRRALAGALGCTPSCVGIKAKRCEGIGSVGRREGILAQAIVLLGRARRPSRPPAPRRGAGR